MRSSRRRAAPIAVLATLVLGIVAGPTGTSAHAAGMDRFMDALGQVESGGNYTARNPTSGAYGKYQIMPFNWGPWARRYIGTSSAPQSPRNQEIVARGRVHDLRQSLGSWRRVAYRWLTGSTKTTGWSTYATRYVAKVMRLYQGAPDIAGADVRRYSEKSSAIEYTGRWKVARHRGYRGDAVRYAKAAGATATFTFEGSKVSWYGPKGSTRGKARIYVDGTYVRTVDLHARGFRARNRLFTRTWKTAGSHVLTIKVVGTPGRPVVAIDEFVVVQ